MAISTSAGSSLGRRISSAAPSSASIPTRRRMPFRPPPSCPSPTTCLPTVPVLAGTVETAVNALWDAAPLIGDRVAVVGGGMVGPGRRPAPGSHPWGGGHGRRHRPEPGRRRRSPGAGYATPQRPARLRPRRPRERDRRRPPVGPRPPRRGRLGSRPPVGMATPRSPLPLGGSFHARRLAIRASRSGCRPRPARQADDHRPAPPRPRTVARQRLRCAHHGARRSPSCRASWPI